MALTRKSAYRLAIVLSGLYITILGLLYFFQEKLLFNPQVLEQGYQFSFDHNYTEVFIPVEQDVKLHGLLFSVTNSKGLIFYLHGNGGCADGWGHSARLYNALGYDIFMLDYRGYGKSGGHIECEEQLLEDVRKAYDYMLSAYDESNVMIGGYSIGTGPAAFLASVTHPKALLLQAPYYSLTQLIDEKVPLLPGFVKRYKLETFSYLKKVSAPVFFFHGTNDELIPYSHSERLADVVRGDYRLVLLEGLGHNNIKDCPEYVSELEKCLSGL